MVTGKYHALFFKQKADMVIDMTRRANRAKRPPFASDAIVIFDLRRRLKGQVLMPVIRRHPANQRGAGRLR